MKKTLRSCLAIVLALTILSSFSLCFAATEKKHLDYGSYVLLGDSIACGWSDLKSADEQDTSFTRVEGSYGAIIADALDVTYYPEACIGFRTHEMRYVLEENYVGDDFMFYAINKNRVDEEKDILRKRVSEAGLITLNVGGNDWGSYLGWNVFEIMDSFDETNAEFLAQAKAALEEAGTGLDTINTLIDIASYTGCLPQFVQVLPKALDEGYTNYVNNWSIMIEDIYALNPDVTLVVIGMFDTSLQDPVTMANDTTEGIQNIATKLEFGQAIVDLANKTMKEAADKYDYIFIDPVGTYCELQHPSNHAGASGHRHIADLVLDALPYANFPYEDVKVGDANYRAIEYMWANDIIDGITDTTFAPDKNFTKGDLNKAIAKITDTEATDDSTSDATRIEVISAVLKADPEASFMDKIKTLGFAIKCFMNNFKFNFLSPITRAEAAKLLFDYINL